MIIDFYFPLSASLSTYHNYERDPSSSSLVKRKGIAGVSFFLLNYFVSIRSHNLYFNISMCEYKVTDADFQKGFENWCKNHEATFSSEEDKQRTFNWFRKTYIYGREFPCGAAPPVHRKDIIDCLRRYGIHGDSKVMYEFLLERSRCTYELT